MGGVAKEWMWKIFSHGHILSTVGDALTCTRSQKNCSQLVQILIIAQHI